MKAVNRRRPAARRQRPHLPTAWRGRVRRAGVTLLGFAGVLLAAGMTNEALSIRAWRIEGVDPFLHRAINAELTAMQPLDFLHAQPARLRRRLLAALPDLADVHITRRLPDELRIVGVMRHPLATWQQGKALKLIDGRGSAYVSRREGVHWNLPVLRAGPRHLAAAGRLLAELRHMDARRYAGLSECVFLAPDTWALYFSRGRRWLLPADDSAVRRLRTLLAILDRPRWRGHAWRVDARMNTKCFLRPSSPQGGSI